MTAFWVILAPFIAIAIIGVAAWAAVVVTDVIRRYDYRLFEEKSALPGVLSAASRNDPFPAPVPLRKCLRGRLLLGESA